MDRIEAAGYCARLDGALSDRSLAQLTKTLVRLRSAVRRPAPSAAPANTA